MEEGGKKIKEYLWRGEENDGVSSECHYSYSPDLPCKKHPSVSFVGICPYCLNDRLLALVCSDCGEQRLSSCSCSDFSPNRITFLLKKEKTNDEISKQSHKTDGVVFFRRSNSSCVEIKRRSRGIWGIGRFLRRVGSKREAGFGKNGEKGNSWGSERNDGKKQGVSRSISLCSFRGNGFYVGSEDGSSYSGARSSISAARSSSVNGGFSFLDTEPRRSGFDGRKSGFSETEHRNSNFSETERRRSCFEGRKSNFSETEHRKSNIFSESEQRRSYFNGRKSNFSETELRKSNFSETEHRRSCFEGRKSNFSETEQRREGRRSNFIETEHQKSNFSETEQKREGRRSNFSEIEHQKSNFTETEQRRSYFEGRRCNFIETEHQKSNFGETEHRRSCYEGRKSNFSDTEQRRTDATNNPKRRVFFTGNEEPGFIDLKFDYSSSEMNPNFSPIGSMREFPDRNNYYENSKFQDLILDHGGGSCRITADERGIKKSRKSFKGWRWIFRH